MLSNAVHNSCVIPAAEKLPYPREAKIEHGIVAQPVHGFVSGENYPPKPPRTNDVMKRAAVLSRRLLYDIFPQRFGASGLIPSREPGGHIRTADAPRERRDLSALPGRRENGFRLIAEIGRGRPTPLRLRPSAAKIYAAVYVANRRTLDALADRGVAGQHLFGVAVA